MSERPSWCPENETPVLDLADLRVSVLDIDCKPWVSVRSREFDQWDTLILPLTSLRQATAAANETILCARCGNKPCCCVGGVPVIADGWSEDPEDE